MRGDGLLVPDLAAAPPRKPSLLPIPPTPSSGRTPGELTKWCDNLLCLPSHDAHRCGPHITNTGPLLGLGGVLGHSRCSIHTCRAKLGSAEQKFLPQDPSGSLPLPSSCFPFTYPNPTCPSLPSSGTSHHHHLQRPSHYCHLKEPSTSWSVEPSKGVSRFRQTM